MRKHARQRMLVLLVVACWRPASASADADKEHKLLMAEIRMLQEEQQQLRAVLARPRRHAQGAERAARHRRRHGCRKPFADQKLVVEGVAETTRILREKADETNVRLSSMTQELQSLRQTVASMPPPAPACRRRRPASPPPAIPRLRADARGSRRRRRSAAEHLADADVGSRVRGLHRGPVRSGRRRVPVVTSGRSRRRRRPTMRSCTSATRSTAPASTPRR